jgi:hypothetical protein
MLPASSDTGSGPASAVTAAERIASASNSGALSRSRNPGFATAACCSAARRSPCPALWISSKTCCGVSGRSSTALRSRSWSGNSSYSEVRQVIAIWASACSALN